jgi:hypothetical protein
VLNNLLKPTAKKKKKKKKKKAIRNQVSIGVKAMRTASTLESSMAVRFIFFPGLLTVYSPFKGSSLFSTAPSTT